MQIEKDEELADFIKAYTSMDWEAIKRDLPVIPTEKLIEIMLELKLYVNKSLALEIAKRSDAVFWMRKLLLEDEQYWFTDGPGEAWAPYHAIHILALVKGREALDLLLDAMRDRSEDLGDWLSESCTSLLVAFGEDAIESLKEFTEDETIDTYARLAATAAIAVLARKFPSHKENVKVHLIKLLNATGDTTFASFVSGDLASLRDPSVMPEIQRAFKAGKIERSIITEKDFDLIISGLDDDFERNTRDPLKHFSRESVEYLHSFHYPELKKVKIEKKNFDSGEMKTLAGKDEDLADLIGSETSLGWDEIKAKMFGLPTKELVEVMADLKLYVNKPLALEIVNRNDAVFWLRKLLQDGNRWYNSTGYAWSPVHALHILALMKSGEALDLLLDTLRFRGNDLEDFLTESVPSLLVAFGENGVEKLKEFSLDETLEPFVRGTAITALFILAKKFPSRVDDVKSHLIKLLNTTSDSTFAGLVADDLAWFHDFSVLPEIRRAFESGRIDELTVTEEEIDEIIRGVYADLESDEFKRHTEDPVNHFSRERIEQLRSIYQPEPEEDFEDHDEYEDDFFKPEPPKPRKKKIGRNEPCPCGSGIKYKKCCLGKETSQLREKTL